MNDKGFSILLSPSKKITEVKFCAWLTQAKPGEVLEYHRGFLCLDRGDDECRKKDALKYTLNQVANRALALEQAEFIHLVQRRIGPDTFSYIAIARLLPEGKSLDFKTLMNEEAA